VKAAVVDHAGGIPRYQDFPDPEVGDGQVLVTVEAVAVENVDRAIVAGTHYTAAPFQGRAPGDPLLRRHRPSAGRNPCRLRRCHASIRNPRSVRGRARDAHGADPDGIAPATAAVLSTAIMR
jgi:NADPH2:quinone reductase